MKGRIPMSKIFVFTITTILALSICGCKKEQDLDTFSKAKKAILDEDVDRLNIYLKKDVSVVKARDQWDKSTLLHVACSSTQKEQIIQVLLDTSSDVNAQDDLGRTPLHNAYIFMAGEPVLKLLRDAGADESVKDSYAKVPTDYKKEF